MIDITLYTNTSEVNKLDKTLLNPRKYQGTMRNLTSMLRPVIDLHEIELNIREFNYMYIPAFKRYYFITNAETVVNGFCRLYTEVDVLGTWKEYIRAQAAILARQQSTYNLYLNDDRAVVRQNKKVTLTRLEGDTGGLNHVSWVLITAGVGIGASQEQSTSKYQYGETVNLIESKKNETLDYKYQNLQSITRG